MSNPARSPSGHVAIVIAVIGAAATIIAALVGVLPSLLSSRADKPGDSSSALLSSQPDKKKAGLSISPKGDAAFPEPKQPPVNTESNAVYLADMVEEGVQDQIAKNGFMWFRKRTISSGNPIIVSGTPSPNGIFFQAGTGQRFAQYQLEQKYARFLTDVSICKAWPDQENPFTPLTFEVLGDGRSLWKSILVRLIDQKDRCSVDVKGVRTLKLVVHCPGNNAWACGVWLEPRLKLVK